MVKNNRKLIEATCSQCGKSRGLKRPDKLKGLCTSCSRFGVRNKDIFLNVDFLDFKKNNNSISYRTKCISCRKDKGYSLKKDFLKSCLSCSAINNHKHMSSEKKLNKSIKTSCTQRNMPFEEFDGFSTPLENLERDRFKTSGLREQCFEKADYTCDITGKKGCELNAHHLESWHSNEELRYDIDNLVCISKEMHDEFHRVYGRKNNTKEQYEEFKKSYFKEPSFLY